MNEEYRVAERFPEYRVYRDGRVYDTTKGRFLQMRKARSGKARGSARYQRVSLRKPDGTHMQIYVHRLMIEAWYGPEFLGKLTVDHLDGNRNNNSLDNLDLCSKEENPHRYQRFRKSPIRYDRVTGQVWIPIRISYN